MTYCHSTQNHWNKLYIYIYKRFVCVPTIGNVDNGDFVGLKTTFVDVFMGPKELKKDL